MSCLDAVRRLAHFGAEAPARLEDRKGRHGIGQTDAGRWLVPARGRDGQGREGDEQYKRKS